MATAMVPRARGDARERDREIGREGERGRERERRERERIEREDRERERVYGPIPANQDS